MKIAFALLAHQHPQIVARLARRLVDAGFTVALHYDLKSPAGQFKFLVETFADCPSVRFTRRIDVRWGMWSVVEATLLCLDEIDAAGWEPDYVYHASGSDYPIRSSAELIRFLERHSGKEFIESVSAKGARWVKGGPQQERYQYRFPLNWREQKLLFDALLLLQKKFLRPRGFVRDMEPFIGSQWWVLTWKTLQKIRELARQRDIRNFFRTTLIPDELFFQSLVRHLVAESEVIPRALTLNRLTDYGIPTVFYVDHVPHLIRQPFFMARKISPYNVEIYDALDSYWRGEKEGAPIADDGIGSVSAEYETRRLAYRNGPPGKSLVGGKPNERLGDLARLETPFLAVMGTSTLQLRLFHGVLAGTEGILFHRQLFHSRCIEFAPGVERHGGFRRKDIAMRGASLPDFLGAMVRSEPDRLTGFLLRWGQGGRIAEVLFERPNARIVVVRGDLLLSFVENVMGLELLLDEHFNFEALKNLSVDVFVDRFRRFQEQFSRHSDWLAKKMQAAATAMVRTLEDRAELDNWLSAAAATPPGRGPNLILDIADLRGPAIVSADGGATARSGPEMSGSLHKVNGDDVSATLASCVRIREIAVGKLMAGGMTPEMIEVARRKIG